MSSTDFERRTIRIWALVAAGAAGVALGLRLAAFAPDIALWGTGTNPSKAKPSEEAPAAASRLKAIVSGLEDDQQGTRTLRIVAPTNGTITSSSSAPGAFLNDPTVSIVTIANLDTVWVSANVPENALSFIAKNQEVQSRSHRIRILCIAARSPSSAKCLS